MEQALSSRLSSTQAASEFLSAQSHTSITVLELNEMPASHFPPPPAPPEAEPILSTELCEG